MATEKVYIGNDYAATVTVKEDGTAIDITGGTLKLIIRDYTDTIIHTETVTSFSDPTNGIASIEIAGATTADFTQGVFRYVVNFTSSTSKNWDVITGMFDIADSVTV